MSCPASPMGVTPSTWAHRCPTGGRTRNDDQSLCLRKIGSTSDARCSPFQHLQQRLSGGVGVGWQRPLLQALEQRVCAYPSVSFELTAEDSATVRFKQASFAHTLHVGRERHVRSCPSAGHAPAERTLASRQPEVESYYAVPRQCRTLVRLRGLEESVH